VTTFNKRNSIFDAVLGRYYDYGFRLVEPDDHLVELWFKDKCIAVYNQSRLTISTLHEGCENYLKSLARF
jgi:hypothetical protein